MLIPQFKTYIFDVDGTLLNTVDLIHSTFSEVFAQYGVKDLSRDKLISLMGYPLRDISKILLGAKYSDYHPEIVSKIRKLQAERYQQLSAIYPSVADGLEKLKSAGKQLGIVTSRNPDTLNLLLKYHKISHYFDVVITPADTEFHKPDPQPLLHALTQISAESADSIYIGDAEVDIACGRSAGVKTGLVGWTRNNHAEFAHSPDYHIKSLLHL